MNQPELQRHRLGLCVGMCVLKSTFYNFKFSCDSFRYAVYIFVYKLVASQLYLLFKAHMFSLIGNVM